ncbi:MAG: AAA family ATPase [Planctomycetota bacterium]
MVGVTISGVKDSFFEDLNCVFSENLSCIIGPRGSGKSTLVEALRYVFGYNKTLLELDKDLADRIRSLQEANLSGALVRLYYQRKDGEVRVLEATYDPKQEYTTKVFDEDGKGVAVDDVERSGDYPLRLYGWSEIETLGRDQSRQRALLDRMIPNIKDSIDRRKEIRDKLESNRQEVRSKILDLRRTLEKNQEEIYRYSEYKKDFEELDQEAVRERFEEIDLLEAKKSILVIVRENVSSLAKDIEGLEPINVTEGVEKVISRFGEKLEDWWQQEQIREREIIRTEQFIAEEIGKIKQRLEQLKNSLLTKEDGLARQIEQAYQKLRNVLSGEPDKQRIADLRRNAKARLDRVSAIRDEYLKQWKELRSLLAERRNAGADLKRAQNEVTGIRATMINTVQERLNQFMGARLKVSIKMLAGGDKAEFFTGLEKFLRAPGRRINRRVQQVVSSMYDPVDFGNVLLERNWTKLIGKHSVKGEEIEIDKADGEKLRETKDWYEHHDEADIDRLLENGERLLAVLAVQEIAWDDQEAILLNDQPVDRLSPGQRSSAMLPLIALAEKSPLVIDQPEDNLDNRLVGHVLVDILAELKEHRQIIVCTHNPNIVVSGDAEQVIALEAESDRKGKLEIAGSIDNDDIVNTVIELMEGGREAFRVRKERYGI